MPKPDRPGTCSGERPTGRSPGEQLDTVVHRNDFWFAWAAFNEGDPVYGT
jgi:hypothetical protein